MQNLQNHCFMKMQVNTGGKGSRNLDESKEKGGKNKVNGNGCQRQSPAERNRRS